MGGRGIAAGYCDGEALQLEHWWHIISVLHEPAPSFNGQRCRMQNFFIAYANDPANNNCNWAKKRRPRHSHSYLNVTLNAMLQSTEKKTLPNGITTLPPVGNAQLHQEARALRFSNFRFNPSTSSSSSLTGQFQLVNANWGKRELLESAWLLAI